MIGVSLARITITIYTHKPTVVSDTGSTVLSPQRDLKITVITVSVLESIVTITQYGHRLAVHIFCADIIDLTYGTSDCYRVRARRSTTTE